MFDIAQIKADWSMQNVLDEQLAAINAAVGPSAHAICALSGGVDSAVAATLVHRALGDRLHCVFVDNGLLRYKERERVEAIFNEHLHLPVTIIDASQRTLDKLRGVTDPEAKRKAIGAEFIAVRLGLTARACGTCPWHPLTRTVRIPVGISRLRGDAEGVPGHAAGVPGAGDPVPRRHRVLPAAGQQPKAQSYH